MLYRLTSSKPSMIKFPGHFVESYLRQKSEPMDHHIGDGPMIQNWVLYIFSSHIYWNRIFVECLLTNTY